MASPATIRRYARRSSSGRADGVARPHHPCVIAWSLGNESGYGAAARRDGGVDPARRSVRARCTTRARSCTTSTPQSRERSRLPDVHAGRANRPLVAGAPRPRRPLILCEYGHAMGHSRRTDDYWAAFGVEPGLQGGFVWEWADHGTAPRARRRHDVARLRRRLRRGRPRRPLLCDGLVSADRVPHPSLAELASLAQPVTVERRPDGRLRVHNRRWFTDLSDVGATWEATAAGVVIGSGQWDVPAIGARSSADLDDPSAALGAATLTMLFRPRRQRSWEAVTQVVVGDDRVPAPRRRRSARCRIDDDGLVIGDLSVGWPVLCLWPAPTDNDDPPGAWRACPGRPSPGGPWAGRAGTDRGRRPPARRRDDLRRPLRRGERGADRASPNRRESSTVPSS